MRAGDQYYRAHAGAEVIGHLFSEDDGRKLLGKLSLTEYSVYQRGRDLEVIFKSDRPRARALAEEARTALAGDAREASKETLARAEAVLRR